MFITKSAYILKKFTEDSDHVYEKQKKPKNVRNQCATYIQFHIHGYFPKDVFAKFF